MTYKSNGTYANLSSHVPSIKASFEVLQSKKAGDDWSPRGTTIEYLTFAHSMGIPSLNIHNLLGIDHLRGLGLSAIRDRAYSYTRRS